MPNLKVVEEKGYFFVRDMDENTNYGKYTSKEEAEDALEGWKAYYQSEL